MPTKPKKSKSPRNKTLTVDKSEIQPLAEKILGVENEIRETNKIVHGEVLEVLPRLEPKTFDLLIADPPYNLTKTFGGNDFKKLSDDGYAVWLEEWLSLAAPLLKTNASAYICGDWRSSSAIERVGSKYLTPRNRITWEREKGRGAKANWKNSSEDIWFFTVSDDYTFNRDEVRLKRKVIAPYRKDGKPKDWKEEGSGNFRLTAPSNLWNDLTVPFWSMSENTEHPTQKPEKLAAKLILASSNRGDSILDPFAGSGTFSVVAQKLERKFLAIESDLDYCLVAQKRLDNALREPDIQGFKDGVFWERNSG